MERTLDNPHGLGVMPSRDELKARRRRLLRTVKTASVAIDRLDEIKARCLASKPAVLPELGTAFGEGRNQ